MKSFVIFFAVCLATASANLLNSQQLHCDDTVCTGSISYGLIPLTTKFRYKSTVPEIRSTVRRYDQNVAENELLKSGKQSTQCVDLLIRGDKLCVFFDSTYNTTNAKVKLYYRASTKLLGDSTSDTQVVKFTPDGSSWYTLN